MIQKTFFCQKIRRKNWAYFTKHSATCKIVRTHCVVVLKKNDNFSLNIGENHRKSYHNVDSWMPRLVEISVFWEKRTSFKNGANFETFQKTISGEQNR
jgi:hypothetical protein